MKKTKFSTIELGIPIRFKVYDTIAVFQDDKVMDFFVICLN